MQDHFEACDLLSLKIVDAICLSLGCDKNQLEKCFRPKHTSFLRLNYYPVKDPLSDLETRNGKLPASAFIITPTQERLRFFVRIILGDYRFLKMTIGYPSNLSKMHLLLILEI